MARRCGTCSRTGEEYVPARFDRKCNCPLYGEVFSNSPACAEWKGRSRRRGDPRQTDLFATGNKQARNE